MESFLESAEGIRPEPTPEPIPEAAPEPSLTGSEGNQEIEESKSREVEESKPRGVDELTATPRLVDSSTSEPLGSPTSEPLDSSTPGIAAGAPAVIAPEWVYVVVHKVVAKMAPPALSAEQVEKISRMLA